MTNCQQPGEPAPSVEQLTVPAHTIDPHRDLDATLGVFHGVKSLCLGAFRHLRRDDGTPDEEHVLARLMPTGGNEGCALGDEVIVPRRWEVTREHTIQFAERHKGVLAVVGAVAVVAAAGAGITVRRLRQK